MTAIDIQDLVFRYSDNHVALRGVSFQIQEGESVGLIGPNGAGKSTLLMHLNGILPETHNNQSSISIFGLSINESNLFTIRRNVGLLFQDPDNQLFCPTVYEDVAFGPSQFGKTKNEVNVLVKEALIKVGLQGFENRSPHHLSEGEKQKVCLAGVLACQPKVFALDEAYERPRSDRKTPVKINPWFD